MSPALQLEDIVCGWGQKSVVETQNASMELAANGGVLPLIGRSGAGKSTLLYVMAGMAMPLNGRVEWTISDEGQTVEWTHENMDAAKTLRLESFGFLMQDASLIPFLTIAESIMHLLEMRGIGGNDDERRKMAISAIGKMCIAGEKAEILAASYPARLSGGQKHRMALAVAMSHDPAVLFADEPTGSLDDDSRHEILQQIRAWVEEGEGKRAFVFVTHHKEEIDILGAKKYWEVCRDNKNDISGIVVHELAKCGGVL